MEGLIPTMAPSASGYGERAAGQNLYPLWETTTLHQTGQPQSEAPCHWRWTDVEPLVAGAIEETSMSQCERRVLLMGHPGFAGVKTSPRVTPALHAAIQTLMPGESARAHRHTPNALRFVLEDGGETYTLVDGKACRMERRDVILTPANTWHGHYHNGTRRSVWFDALDSQLSAYFDAGFFEPPGPDLSNLRTTAPDEAFVEPGLSPVLPETVPTGYSPRFRLPWTSVVAALKAAPPHDDGSIRLRFTNPMGGATALRTMDCFMVQVGRTPTRPLRTTAGTICVVAAGSGVSTFGDTKIRWTERDVFTVPHWSWTTHAAESEDAVLFMVSDRLALEPLGLLREEYA